MVAPPFLKEVVFVLGGYMGRVLWVNLTDGTVREEPLDEKLARDFVGGYGLAARITYDRMDAHVDALGPENILGFVTGPLTGTPCIEGNRFVVTCKSPLTGTWGDANCGGTFGPALKFAGFDAIFFTGMAPAPVYLHIHDGIVQLKSAAHLWGKDSNETEDALKAELGKDAEVACIGQAGEKLSLIAGVMNDYGRAAGRSGVGAVMGSKHLKAIACQGKQPVPLADPEKAKELRRTYMKLTEPSQHDFFKATGTIGILGPGVFNGDSPVKNWGGVGQVDFPKGFENFDPDRVMEYQDRKYGCWQCTLACGGHMEVKEGPYKVKTHKVEYETGAAFGTMTLNDNFPSLVKINDLCNRYGFDSISAGCTVAFAVECYENGILTKADTGGLELNYGNHAAMVELLKLMGERRGIGHVLADGVRKAAEQIGKGSEQYAIHIQGEEIPMHDPKLQPGLAVTYLLDATPARHTQGGELNPVPGLGIKLPPREVQAGRGPLHKELVSLVHVVNSAGVCLFGYLSYDFHFMPDFLTAVTGEAWDVQRIETAGERIANMRHAFNLREGLNPLQWQVPDRLLGRPPLQAGTHKGFTVDLETQVKDYLAAMDWDPVTTKPSVARLRELGLEDLVETIGV
jgi:aldehyde:ferredoxin oxidoreductase